MTRGAVCVRCGRFRSDFRQICPHCGYRPDGEGLLVAWLLSDQHLSEDALQSAAERVKAGESIRPSERMLAKAQQALGTTSGLTNGQRIALLATGILLTPLVGWVLWFWWRRDRPRAAIQALGLSLPATAIFTVLVIWLWVG